MCNTAALLTGGRLHSFESMDGAFDCYDRLMADEVLASS
jgi:hypothetical protein